MIDINSFLIMVLCILCSILLIVLIVLGIKLINTVTRIDNLMTEIEVRVRKFDKLLNMVDTVTDSMALVSDKIVDSIVFCINKIFVKNNKKGEKIDEKK